MNVTNGVGAVTRHYIEDVPGLDPITVFLEDFQPGVGRLTVVCYGKSWTAFWGGMGDCDLRGFMSVVNENYLTDKLSIGKEKKHELAYLMRIVTVVRAALVQEVPQELVG